MSVEDHILTSRIDRRLARQIAEHARGRTFYATILEFMQVEYRSLILDPRISTSVGKSGSQLYSNKTRDPQ